MAPADPPPHTTMQSANPSPRWLLTCDHASNTVPAHMNALGLSAAELDRHIGWDIGAEGVARHMAATLDATLIFAEYSRLVIDLNRPLASPTLIPALADGTEVPGNTDISEAEIAARAEFFHASYHGRIADELDQRLGRNEVPVLVAVHSFTPVFDNFHRPWQVGLLYEHDARLIAPLRAALLTADPTLSIGDNEPYAIRGPSDYTIPVHGQGRGLPHIEIEIRQDLIANEAGQQYWAMFLTDALVAAVAAAAPLTLLPKTKA
ncbi:MAG: N-formylglutamate amidohydrolase [Alphaproteobacteria bacterium]|nr:N-formylglutamate amidohydrolase [Alphaproteobacteria bacterium]